MFQDMNVMKSVPFALLAICKLPCTPPKVIKKPQFLQIMRKITDHFPIRPMENGTPQIYSECSKIHSNSPTIDKNHAKSV